MHRFFLMARISCPAPAHSLSVLTLDSVCLWANYETSLPLLLSERCPCAIEGWCPLFLACVTDRNCVHHEKVFLLKLSIKTQGGGGFSWYVYVSRLFFCLAEVENNAGAAISKISVETDSDDGSLFTGLWKTFPWIDVQKSSGIREGTYCRRPWMILNPRELQVVPGRAGGGSYRRKKNYIAKKEFAYRLCARRPTSAMPKSFLCCERAFCRSMVVMCRGGDVTCFDVMRLVAV